MLKNLTIHKRKEVKAATHPTHDLVASDEKYENKVVVGAMWTRVTEDGTKFLSGSLSKSRTYEGKEYDGYVFVTEKEYKEYQELKSNVTKAKTVASGGVPNFNYEAGEVNIEDIPF